MQQGLPSKRSSCGGHRISSRLHGFRCHSEALLHVWLMRQHVIRPLALPCCFFHLRHSLSPACVDLATLMEAPWAKIETLSQIPPSPQDTGIHGRRSQIQSRKARNCQLATCVRGKDSADVLPVIIIELGCDQLRLRLLPFHTLEWNRLREAGSRMVQGQRNICLS